MMTLTAQQIANQARCASCGVQVSNTEQQVREHLARDPSLLASNVRWTIVCPRCVRHGRCPCCAVRR